MHMDDLSSVWGCVRRKNRPRCLEACFPSAMELDFLVSSANLDDGIFFRLWRSQM